MAATRSVSCPACKSSLRYSPGDTYISCKPCNKTFRIQRPFDPKRYAVEVSEFLSMMHKGQNFIQIVSRGGEGIQQQPCFVFLEPGPPEDVKASTLYWCARGRRNMSRERSITLRDIKEMSQGLPKNIEEAMPQLPEGWTRECFLLKSKQYSLILHADTVELCRSWLESIHRTIITRNSSRRSSEQKQEKKRPQSSDGSRDRPHLDAGARRSSVPESSPSNKKNGGAAPKIRPLDAKELESTLQMMIRGSQFRSYSYASTTGSTTVEDCLVFYDKDSKALYWCKPDTKEKLDTNCLPLKIVSDVFLGKRDVTFQSSVAANARPERCFSLLSKTRALNLEALSGSQACKWLSGVHAMLVAMGRVDERSKKSSKHQNALEEPVVKELVAIMRQGHIFTQYLSSPEPAKKQIMLFYSSAGSMGEGSTLGSLFWCEPGSRTKDNAQSMPLDSIKVLTVGKHKEQLRTPVAASAADNCCFSLIAHNGFTLSIEAESRGKLALWLKGIHQLLTTVKPVHDQKRKAPVEYEFDIYSEVTPFKMHVLNKERTVSTITDVTVWYNPKVGGRLGTLFWCLKGSQQIENRDLCLALSTIVELQLGTKFEAFDTPQSHHLNPNNCFTLFCKNGSTLSLEARDSKLREVWLGEVHRILSSPQTEKENARKETRPPPPRKPSAPPRQKLSDTAKLAFGVLSKGALFNKYDLDERGNPFVTEVMVFLGTETSPNTMGRLFWCDPSKPRQESIARVLRLSEVCEITAGKTTPVFQNSFAWKVPDDRSFSIHTSKYVLNLEADSEHTRAAWLHAVHRVLTEYGKKTLEDDARAPPTQPPRPAPPPPSNPHQPPPMHPPPPPTPPRSRYLPGSSIQVTADDPENIFDIKSKIGQGSFGSVFKAVDTRDNQMVALKLLDVNDGSLDDIKGEIDILQKCKSDYIVSLKGVFQKAKTIWIAMEFCAAGSLRDMMNVCHQTLTETQIASVMKMSLQGLKYLHERRTIHRDLKAANILVTESGCCKLADFGVSAEIATTLSRRSTVIGTPNWMAPEVIKESAYDASADIWSLGITAIELAVGDPPLSDLHPMTAMFKIPHAPPPTLPNPKKWSADFHDFIKTCLQKDPKQRPPAAFLLEKHPFVKKAQSREVILSFAESCMMEMKAFKELEETQMDGLTRAYG